MVSPVDSGANQHLWGREVASLLQIPLLWLNSSGQYRMNLAVYREQPHHPMFVGTSPGSWYQGQSRGARLLQKIFVPRQWREANLDVISRGDLRRSGSGLQALAGYGLQLPNLFRLGVNARTLFDPEFWHASSGRPVLRAAVFADTLGLTGGLIQTHFYNLGLRYLHRGLENQAGVWFLRNQRLHVASSSFQLFSGVLRLGFEIDHYNDTGEFRSRYAFFGALDMAAGAGGIAYSRYLLREVGVVEGMAARNNVLMGLAPLPGRLRWGLRGIGLAGNALGLGLSLHAFANAASDHEMPSALRAHRMISSGLGVAASGMMTVSSLLVTPAHAPLAGLLLITGIAILAGQAIFDNSGEEARFQELQRNASRINASARRSLLNGLTWLPEEMGADAASLFSREIQLSPQERDMLGQLTACRGGRRLPADASFETTAAYLQNQFRGVIRTRRDARVHLARIHAAQLQGELASLHQIPSSENAPLRRLFDERGLLRSGQEDVLHELRAAVM